MKNKGHILFQYDNHPLTKSTIDAFQFSQREIKVIYHLTDIMKNYNGIYLLGGNRGTGKTSIMEEAEYKFQKEDKENRTVICKINIPQHSNNLCLRVLYQLQKSHVFHNDTKILRKIQELIIRFESSTNIKNSFSLNSSKNAEATRELNDNQEILISPVLSLPFVTESPLLKGSISSQNKKHFISTKEGGQQIGYIYENEKKYILEDLYYDFIYFMQSMFENSNYKVIVVIDELDKMPKEGILNFLYKNKVILLESNILFFLICDLEQTIYLENTYAHYFNDIIYLSELYLAEFILVTRWLELSENIKDALSLFYVTKGNHRNLIHCYMHDRRKPHNNDLEAKSLFLAYCVQTDFFTKRPPQYRSILVCFLIDIIDSLQLLDSLSEKQLMKLKEEFLLRRSIDSIIISILLDKLILFLKSPIPSPDLSLWESPWLDPKDKILDQILCKLYSNNVLIFDNKLFNYSSILDYYKNYKNIGLQLKDEYFKQVEELFGKNINIDMLLDHRLLDHFGAFKHIPINSLSEDEITLVDDHGEGDYTDNAIDKLILHIPEILGVVIFHPKNRDMVLNNGLIIMDNGIRSIGVPYCGYPGLTSHKYWKFEEFIKTLKKYHIFYKTLGDKDFCPDIFHDRIYDDEKIRKMVYRNKDHWAKELLRCKC